MECRSGVLWTVVSWSGGLENGVEVFGVKICGL